MASQSHDTRTTDIHESRWSQFTVTRALAWLLFACMFLPSLEGCNGETIYPVAALGPTKDLQGRLLSWFVLWPHVFALVAAIGVAWWPGW